MCCKVHVSLSTCCLSEEKTIKLKREMGSLARRQPVCIAMWKKTSERNPSSVQIWVTHWHQTGSSLKICLQMGDVSKTSGAFLKHLVVNGRATFNQKNKICLLIDIPLLRRRQQVDKITDMRNQTGIFTVILTSL